MSEESGMDDGGGSLIWSFGIDNGELDHLKPAMIFCLGAECGQLFERLESGRSFVMLVHAENVARVRRLMNDRGNDRQWRIVKSTDDVSEDWYELHCGGGTQ